MNVYVRQSVDEIEARLPARHRSRQRFALGVGNQSIIKPMHQDQPGAQRREIMLRKIQCTDVCAHRWRKLLDQLWCALRVLVGEQLKRLRPSPCSRLTNNSTAASGFSILRFAIVCIVFRSEGLLSRSALLSAKTHFPYSLGAR